MNDPLFALSLSDMVLTCVLMRINIYLMQGRAAKSSTLGSNTIRWVLGPTGTVVIFSDDLGLPKIFNSVPCRYKIIFFLTVYLMVFFPAYKFQNVYVLNNMMLRFPVILHLVKSVLVQIVQMLTNIVIPNRTFHSAVSIATRQYMERCKL